MSIEATTRNERGGQIDDLIDRVVSGDEKAWHLLSQSLSGFLARLLRGWQLTKLTSRARDRRAIATEVMRRLEERSFRRLMLFLAARRTYPELQFLGW